MPWKFWHLKEFIAPKNHRGIEKHQKLWQENHNFKTLAWIFPLPSTVYVFKPNSSWYWNQVRIWLNLSGIFRKENQVTWDSFDNHLFPQNFFGLQKFFNFPANLFTFDQTLIINFTENIFSQKWKSPTNSLHIDFSN